jgi:hypothetical protein
MHSKLLPREASDSSAWSRAREPGVHPLEVEASCGQRVAEAHLSPTPPVAGAPQAAMPHRPRDGALDPVAPGVLAAHRGNRKARALGSSVSNMRAPGFAAATSRSAEAASNHMGDAHDGVATPGHRRAALIESLERSGDHRATHDVEPGDPLQVWTLALMFSPTSVRGSKLHNPNFR